MILSVLVFLTLVSFLAWATAWAADRGLRKLGRPTRSIWLAGLAAPFVLLLAPLLVPVTGSGAPDGPAGPLGPVVDLSPLVVGSAGTAAWGDLLPWVLAGTWIGSVVWMAAVLLRMHRRLLGERAGWRRTSVEGREVYLSDARGPAVGGVLLPWIVLPDWVAELPAAQRALVVLHEEEHLRAGDTRLLATALLLVALAPWNPFAWLQLKGLRIAMEVDCDRRVLRRVPRPRVYAHSLLAVAARSPSLPSGLAAFTERPSSLETRILAMTPDRNRRTAFGSLLLLLVAVVIGVQACYVDSPVLLDQSEDVSVESPDDLPRARVDVADPARVEANPSFTPFTVAPRISNREEVVAAMQDAYPPLLRDAGIGGTVVLWFFIDEEGTVEDVRIHESGGHQALDRAALDVAAVFRFQPALNGEERVPVWVQFPITFQTG